MRPTDRAAASAGHVDRVPEPEAGTSCGQSLFLVSAWQLMCTPAPALCSYCAQCFPLLYLERLLPHLMHSFLAFSDFGVRLFIINFLLALRCVIFEWCSGGGRSGAKGKADHSYAYICVCCYACTYVCGHICMPRMRGCMQACRRIHAYVYVRVFVCLCP